MWSGYHRRGGRAGWTANHQWRCHCEPEDYGNHQAQPCHYVRRANAGPRPPYGRPSARRWTPQWDNGEEDYQQEQRFHVWEPAYSCNRRDDMAMETHPATQNFYAGRSIDNSTHITNRPYGPYHWRRAAKPSHIWEHRREPSNYRWLAPGYNRRGRDLRQRINRQPAPADNHPQEDRQRRQEARNEDNRRRQQARVVHPLLQAFAVRVPRPQRQ